ncbi:MAG TPA: glycosyltransferase family 2 protein [Candidatus Blautia ornithocaccae]|nr:glycosyltransferase family 2 protein [Candidatus Blautia ornithocaccae]
MDKRNEKRYVSQDVEAVITSYNQGTMILESLQSLCSQTLLPRKIFIIDDGSTDDTSLNILKGIEADTELPIPIIIIRQPNQGVSAARNTGIRRAEAPLVLVLDGDDRVEPSYIKEVRDMLRKNPSMTAASSWLHTFGILEAEVRPMGGGPAAFLSRNCCPATHMLRRQAWAQCGGYDESMRSGFEDWDFFLSMLETAPDAHIGIVEKPLIGYRTAPASFSIRSMSRRLELIKYLIEKHNRLYTEHMAEAILGIESISMSRLYGWENEILESLNQEQTLSRPSQDFLKHPTYGDGGMAAAVRIASLKESCSP